MTFKRSLILLTLTLSIITLTSQQSFNDISKQINQNINTNIQTMQNQLQNLNKGMMTNVQQKLKNIQNINNSFNNDFNKINNDINKQMMENLKNIQNIQQKNLVNFQGSVSSINFNIKVIQNVTPTSSQITITINNHEPVKKTHGQFELLKNTMNFQPKIKKVTLPLKEKKS